MNGNRAYCARVGMVQGEMDSPLTHLFKTETLQGGNDLSAGHARQFRQL